MEKDKLELCTYSPIRGADSLIENHLHTSMLSEYPMKIDDDFGDMEEMTFNEVDNMH